jgi:hypothetical protein
MALFHFSLCEYKLKESTLIDIILVPVFPSFLSSIKEFYMLFRDRKLELHKDSLSSV